MLEFSQKADRGLQTEINGSLLFNSLRERGPASRAELAKRLKLQRTAVGKRPKPPAGVSGGNAVRYKTGSGPHRLTAGAQREESG